MSATMTLAAPQTQFELPPGAAATEPPEARGLARDGVRLLVASGHGIAHTRFESIGDYLSPGDLLVVNNSATIAAAVDARRRRDGRPAAVHFANALDDGRWVVEIRPPGRATGQLPDVEPGERLDLPAGASLTVIESYPVAGAAGSRLWRARVAIEGQVTSYLAAHGRPIRYAYVECAWPLRDYQTVFARHPGSAEMASAARPFSADLVTSLVSRGIAIAPITLHTSVSSADAGEPPVAERYDVPTATARLVNLTRAGGGRVVAVGTTAARALESAADPTGTVAAVTGWTELVLGPDRPPRVVSGLITGWHDAGASHLLLLESVAGVELVGAAYRAAVEAGYLWHEFGDSALLLPPLAGRRRTHGKRTGSSHPSLSPIRQGQ